MSFQNKVEILNIFQISYSYSSDKLFFKKILLIAGML